MVLQFSAARSPRPIIGLLLTLLLIAGVHLDLSHAKELRSVAAADGMSKAGETVAAMEQWLALIDGGKYEKSWREGSVFFRKNVTSAQWVAASQSVHQPLGSIEEGVAVSAAPFEGNDGICPSRVSLKRPFGT